MSKEKFRRPVRIQLGRVDRDRIVLGTRDAAEILLRDWPLESDRRVRAMAACLDVIKQKKPPSAARKAFVAAAKEAGIFLGDYELN